MAETTTPDIFRRAQSLVLRLEKISPDSPWAHRASGIRASLAKTLSRDDSPDIQKVRQLMAAGYAVLEDAAARIPGDQPDVSPAER